METDEVLRAGSVDMDLDDEEELEGDLEGLAVVMPPKISKLSWKKCFCNCKESCSSSVELKPFMDRS